MRARGLVWLGAVIAVVLAASALAAFTLSRRVQGSPEEVSAEYFSAWRAGRLETMRRMVADPPGDFLAQHRALTAGLHVYSIRLKPGPLVRDGETAAHQEYEVTRNLGGRVTWRFRSTVRIALVDREWKVLWSPATLHPDLRGPGRWKLTDTGFAPATFLDRDGGELAAGGPLGSYITALADRFGQDDDSRGWAVEFTDQGAPRPRRLALLGTGEAERVETTLDPRIQAAAEKAISGRGAAIVAIRPSTGEVLAVADGLGGRNAFMGAYPPGSTFKVVTAAALLSDGMSSGSPVSCPASAVTAQRTIRNSDDLALGGTSLRNAFAHSCNTTFATLAVERAGAEALASAARMFGFDGPITPGVPATRASFPDPGSGAELAEAAIGQGRVQASPLTMALVAAAVADGTWRPPRLVDADRIRESGERPQPSRRIPNASALRDMMRAVVTDGTADRAGLPSGTAGKTGTAEIGTGDAAHAWFIGYRDDLAFAVLVAGGGSGADAAAPLAARFLKG
ncbi:penicillin-binding transpeptidase domain-containing protein [Thermomonospora cellulosilytica]|uniref:NTF2-like N-terminal transpeptidase domain-containing protein n=1 Tax=Thermomonospora cellulosilytica TaxID=1411118 RepID=A0A7W3R8T7_9ACTN|nr:penicillin-binding transpeptidase domain-containing protein [Thermomonospora cellulosilytica]MBA9003944.1 hypothetical protein [Thermomonospora cellulosilytica]